MQHNKTGKAAALGIVDCSSHVTHRRLCIPFRPHRRYLNRMTIGRSWPGVVLSRFPLDHPLWPKRSLPLQPKSSSDAHHRTMHNVTRISGLPRPPRNQKGPAVHQAFPHSLSAQQQPSLTPRWAPPSPPVSGCGADPTSSSTPTPQPDPNPGRTGL